MIESLVGIWFALISEVEKIKTELSKKDNEKYMKLIKELNIRG